MAIMYAKLAIKLVRPKHESTYLVSGNSVLVSQHFRRTCERILISIVSFVSFSFSGIFVPFCRIVDLCLSMASQCRSLIYFIVSPLWFVYNKRWEFFHFHFSSFFSPFMGWTMEYLICFVSIISRILAEQPYPNINFSGLQWSSSTTVIFHHIPYIFNYLIILIISMIFV